MQGDSQGAWDRALEALGAPAKGVSPFVDTCPKSGHSNMLPPYSTLSQVWAQQHDMYTQGIPLQVGRPRQACLGLQLTYPAHHINSLVFR